MKSTAKTFFVSFCCNFVTDQFYYSDIEIDIEAKKLAYYGIK